MTEYFIGPAGVFPSFLAAWAFAITQLGFMLTEARPSRLTHIAGCPAFHRLGWLSCLGWLRVWGVDF